MTALEALKEIMSGKEVKQATLAKRLNITSATLCERLKQKNVSVKVLHSMLRVLDYKIVLVPADERMKDEWYEVE